MTGYVWKVLIAVSASLGGFYVWGTTLGKEGPHLNATTSPALKWDLRVVAHRGGGLEGPENVIETFQALHQELPSVVLETDVHLSKDGELVAIHDATVDRTTNGSGRVDAMTVTEIQALDAGYHWKDPNGQTPFRGKGLKVPLLKEVLTQVPGANWIIEIKDKRLATPEKFRALIRDLNLQDRVVVASQFGQVIKNLRHYQPQWAYGASHDEVLKTSLLVRLNLWGLDPMRSDFFFVPERTERAEVVNSSFLDVLTRKNKRVVVWTVNSEEDAKRLWAMGAHGVFTDRPRALFQLLAR